MNKISTMSNTPSNNYQSNEDDDSRPLAKKFFDKLRKDGPKRDKVGHAYVRHISGQAQNPLELASSKSDELSNQTDLLYGEQDKPSGTRMLRQLRTEIRRELAEMQKHLDSNPANPTNEK